jgi:hypothetical protein
MERRYFCDYCKHAMAKGGRVTLNIAVNEPHKAPFPPSFKKELCPLCYEFQPLVLSKLMQVFSLTARAQEELTKPKDTPERMAWRLACGARVSAAEAPDPGAQIMAAPGG